MTDRNPLDGRVLYLDNHLLVVDKPAGLLSQADRSGDPDLLTLGKQIIQRRFDKPGQVFLGLVHRLDRPVSGVVVLARTSKAAARLSIQFRERTVQKYYLAVVQGLPEDRGLQVVHIAKEDERVRIVEPGRAGARQAELSWHLLTSDGRMSVVRVVPVTGRPHQIRITMAHAGHPVVGDRRYGARVTMDGRNIALHCERMVIVHPTKREPVSFAAEIPDVWRSSFGRLVDISQG